MKALFDQAESILGVTLDPSRYLLVGNARWKRSVFLYEPGNAEPSVVAKMPANEVAQQQCDREYSSLKRFAQYDIQDVIAPRAAGEMIFEGFRCYFQHVIISHQWLGKILLSPRGPQRRSFLAAAAYLTRVYQSTRHPKAENGKSYARCFQHGDFWIGNLGQKGSSLVLYDFEYARDDGFPLFDLLQFALYFKVALNNIGKVGTEIAKGSYDRKREKREFVPSIEDVAMMFVDPGPFRDTVAASIQCYCEGCGTSREDAATLLKEYIEQDRGISGLTPGWEHNVL